MTVGTKGLILWIILLQSCHFALGELQVLCDSTIHSDLQAKRAAIQQSKTPAELIANLSTLEPSRESKTTSIPEATGDDANQPSENPPKKPCKLDPNNWHPKLCAALEKALKDTNEPYFTKKIELLQKKLQHVVLLPILHCHLVLKHLVLKLLHHYLINRMAYQQYFQKRPLLQTYLVLDLPYSLK